MIWPAPFEWLSIRHRWTHQRRRRRATPHRARAIIGGFVLGTTLGLVWTPCAGPVLGSILTVVATSKDTAWASTLLVVYAIGAATPDAGDRLWRTGRHHPRSQHRANFAAAAAGIRRDRDRFAILVLLPIRHADRGVADGILSAGPDRPVIHPQLRGDFHDATIARRFRFRDRALPDRRGQSRHVGEAARDQTPFAVAAVQSTAPDFAGISNWFNSAPLNIANLRGKVVLVDFWTYGCVNCVNTLPHVTELYAKYKDRGLVVVGVHTPEFPFERSAANVQAALKRHGITYPVAQDNDSQTWNA